MGARGTGTRADSRPDHSRSSAGGNNAAGQLGIGSTDNETSPEYVIRAGAAVGAAAAIGPADNTQSQSAPAGTPVPVVPQVMVGDGAENLLPGITVTWTVLSGGGNVANATSVTDANGLASSGGWTLGPTVGIQKMQATVTGLVLNGAAAPPMRWTFIAYGTGTPAFAVKLSGDNIASSVSSQTTPTAVPQVVKVTNASNVPVANVSVTFAVGANSGNIGVSTSVVVLTDANGLATLPGSEWVPNTAANSTSTLTATVPGIPAPLVFTHFRANSNFGLVACELTNAGAAMCAGLNTFGGVGDNTTTNRSSFVTVSGGLTFTSLASGVAMHRCGLVGTTAYCWGLNSMGQIGDATSTNRLTPTLVSGGHAFTQLAAQGNTTCGLTTTSQVYCWGWAGTGGWGNGEAERGRMINIPTLVNTGGLTFTKVALTDDGVCGLTGAGVIACRGTRNAGIERRWLERSARDVHGVDRWSVDGSERRQQHCLRARYRRNSVLSWQRPEWRARYRPGGNRWRAQHAGHGGGRRDVHQHSRAEFPRLRSARQW